MAREVDPGIDLSASALSNFLACRHLTGLDFSVARGLRAAPAWRDPALVALQERGLDHERRYVETLRQDGLAVTDLRDYRGEEGVVRSIEAMREGVDVIVQPSLRDGRWIGRPDILRRVERRSTLGDWSYEVADTKLAKETRGGTILQLALYADMLRASQGVDPERFHVVTPNPDRPVETYRLQDFAAYFRVVRRRFAEASLDDVDSIIAAHYPEPVEHCEVCRWYRLCDRQRREDDHLSLVAGISRLQMRELQNVGVNTLEALGTLPLPIPFVPSRGSVETYVRSREQARVQLQSRVEKRLVYELLPVSNDQGFARLPTPSPGDVFLDLEGDPFARDGGREYLFGLFVVDASGSGTYHAWWAHTDTEERAAFEAAVRLILDSWAANPGMHVYHYAAYEPGAFKRLMGRHAVHEADVDRMLRAELFVDLHAIVRHSLRAGVERYSIKDLEPFFEYTRAVDLETSRSHLRIVERAIELGARDAITAEDRAIVEGYNRDDCVSARHLRDWLEDLRGDLERQGITIPRPEVGTGAASEKINEREREVRALMERLLPDVPPDPSRRRPDQQARWLMAQLLDWHRREAKGPWWEFFRLRDLSETELLDERAAVCGLEFVERSGGTPERPVDRYRYPPQDTDVREGDELHLPAGGPIGSVAAIDRTDRVLDVEKRSGQADVHPWAVFACSVVRTDAMEKALLRLGEDVAQDPYLAGPRYRAAKQLLLANPPRCRSGAFESRAGESAVEFATRIAPELADTTLAIQGPPGAGKTFTGARMACELVRRGLKVGVSAVSHKVIVNFLEAVQKEADAQRLTVSCAHKVTKKSGLEGTVPEMTSYPQAHRKLLQGELHIVGGTAWLWAREEFKGAVDVLFVDEAGQMSLANVLAVSQAADSVVLLGDPQQLEQPQQGSHPDGTDVSALEHILQGHKTISADRGIFLPETWRLNPMICEFTSEAFYEGRLRSRAGLERQVLVGTGRFDGAGLWTVHVHHEGNQNSSPEEVDAIERISAFLLQEHAGWIDGDGAEHRMTPQDILLVAPYNAQVDLLGDRLAARGIRVGTVDKFQGQQAPVVIYSMATSAPEDAPRGMEFLYGLNRLNVATSRARCAAILVANPRLFEPECRTPRQMQLANALCRYAEFAGVVSVR